MLNRTPPTPREDAVVLGLDPGLARLGFGAVASNPRGDLRALRYGVITTPARQPTPQRLRTLADAVTQLLDELHPAAVALERLYFSTNVRTAMAVGEARGVVLLALQHGSAPVYEFTPQQVKLTVANSGRADKRQVQTMVKLLLRLSQLPQPDDAADALALAICGQRAHDHESVKRKTKNEKL